MKMGNIKSLKILLLVLFTLYYGSTTLFIHTHKLRNIYITHSHPFSESTSKSPVSHQHSDEEYAIIDSISFFVTIALVLFITAIIALNAKIIEYSVKKFVFRSADNFFKHLLRAPPLSISLL